MGLDGSLLCGCVLRFVFSTNRKAFWINLIKDESAKPLTASLYRFQHC